MPNLAEIAQKRRVIEASNYKFESQARAYFPGKFAVVSMDQLRDKNQFLDGRFCMVIERVVDYTHLVLSGYRLVECIVFEGEYFYLTVIRDNSLDGDVLPSIDIKLIPNSIPPETEVTGISLSLICNDVPMYMDFLDRAVEHYRSVLEDFDWEICLAYFGQGHPPNWPLLPPKIHTRHFPRDKFHMAYARNKSMAMCNKSHVLMVSLDCLLSRKQLEGLIQLIPQTNGIINFCKPTHPYPGNALIFGDREKMITNSHWEGFKGFFFEDTEYLMNFSRTGTVPWCCFVDFDYTDHPRGATRGWFPTNQKVFEAILKRGHR